MEQSISIKIPTALQASNSIRDFAASRGVMRKEEFYKAGGKTVPSARALQKMANAQRICSEVVRIEWKNEENMKTALVTAYVRAWVGPRSRPKQEQTDALTMSMSSIMQKYAIKKMQKDEWKEDDVSLDETTGRILPKSKRHWMQMLSFLTDQYSFLDRLAVTKCQSRVFDKMLRPDAETHYGDGGYDQDHTDEQSSTKVVGNPSESEDPGKPAPSEDPTKPPRQDPPLPQEEPAAGQDKDAVDFPPSESDIAEHRKRVESNVQEEKKKEDPMDDETKSLIVQIEGMGKSRAKLDAMSSTLKEAKNTLRPDSYAAVMQTFWNHYRLSE